MPSCHGRHIRTPEHQPAFHDRPKVAVADEPCAMFARELAGPEDVPRFALKLGQQRQRIGQLLVGGDHIVDTPGVHSGVDGASISRVAITLIF